MKSLLHSPLLLTLVSLLFVHTAPLFGATDTTDTKVKKIPFHGKIVALDQSAKTITLNGKSARVLHVTPTTKVIDGSGNPTTLSAASVGEDVGGSYDKADMSLFSLRIGAKLGSKTSSTTPEPMATAPAAPAASEATPSQTAAADAAAASKPDTTAKAKTTRFSGTVTAVDAGSSTFTIKKRTFTVTPSSAITDATGAAGAMSSVTVGEKVSGTYEKAADGTTMTVDTLKVSK